ncbi:MAG: BppU family phage baseplate upper protein [Schleiferilactobacillus harbinensis]|nr:BppU family phage baseplate upper protein [Schleiferilactobacillus harbinensis]
MTIRTYKVTLDTKNAIAPEPVFLRQGDKTGAVVIDAVLMDNGAPISLDGLAPMFKANTADGQAVIADSTGFNVLDSANGEFTYQVPNALGAVPGKIKVAYFSFSDSSGTESTFDVAFVVKMAVDITQEQAHDYITIIDGTIALLQEKVDKLGTDIQTIIDNYNSGNFYTQAETDTKDASTLASAKNYSDANLSKSKDYTNSANDFVLGDGMHFVAHRGNNAQYPENSLAAFRNVTRHWGIETDVQTTSDGRWVIMHDDTVDRTTNGTGRVDSYTFDNIRQLRMDTGNGIGLVSDGDKVIPSVEEYLSICRSTHKTPFMEIKVPSGKTYSSSDYDVLAQAIKNYGMEKNMVVISFDFSALQAIKSRFPLINVSYLVNNYSDDLVNQIKQLSPNAGIDTGAANTVTQANVSYAHQQGLKLGVWTTEDDSLRDTFVANGVDYVTTNSLSGDLRYVNLSLDTGTGWKDNSTDAGVEPAHVEEIAGGRVRIFANIKNAAYVDTGKKIAQLPSWAIPSHNVWLTVLARTSTGVQSSTANIIGMSGGSSAGALNNGLNMTLTWNQVDTIYSI